MYTVFLSRVRGYSVTGNLFFDGRMSFSKHKDLTDAKTHISDEFKQDPYYNYAEITAWDSSEPVLYRYRSGDWMKKESPSS